MQLSKELNDLKVGLTPGEILNNLMEERGQLEEKIHLFKVIRLATDIEKMIESNMFERFGIDNIKLEHQVYNSMNYSAIVYNLYDINGKRINEIVEPVRKIKDLFENMSEIDSTNLSINMHDDSGMPIKLEKGAKEKIINLLLSKDLKTKFDYQMMQSDLDINPENKNKSKPKL